MIYVVVFISCNVPHWGYPMILILIQAPPAAESAFVPCDSANGQATRD